MDGKSTHSMYLRTYEIKQRYKKWSKSQVIEVFTHTSPVLSLVLGCWLLYDLHYVRQGAVWQAFQRSFNLKVWKAKEVNFKVISWE